MSPSSGSVAPGDHSRKLAGLDAQLKHAKRPKANRVDDPSDAEKAELVLRISQSPQLKRKHEGQKLLLFLWSNRRFEIDSEMLEYYFYREILKKGYRPHADRSKMAISSLRKSLNAYSSSATMEKWHCSLPLKQDNEDASYALEFALAPAVVESAPRRFWEPHLLKADDTIVVTGAHLFFYNAAKTLVIRLPFFRAEQSWDSRVILDNAKRSRGDIDLDGFTPWQNTYLATGDIEGYEALLVFFNSTVQKLIVRQTITAISLKDVRKKSPILFGRPQTNPYIDQLFADVSARPGKAKELGYRIGEVQGTVRINGLLEKETRDLKDFPLSPDGVVGPITTMRKVFCIVSRFRYPVSHAPVTVVACDYYSPIIARVVRALTDMSDAQGIFERVGWKDASSIPETFEMLFTVDLLEGDVPDESSPELITWRIP